MLICIFSVTDDAILIKYILTAWNPRHILRFIPFLLRQQFQQSTQHFHFNSPHYWYHLILEGMLKSTSILLILQTLILLTITQSESIVTKREKKFNYSFPQHVTKY